MAQLDIERKSHNSMWWLWLLIALIVVLALWWFVWGGQRDTVGAIPADSAATVAQTPGADSAAPPAASVIGSAGAGAVGAFVNFASETRDDAMGIDHANIATGLRDLAAAGEELATSGQGTPVVTARADSLRSFADQLQRDSTSSRHADVARRAFIVGANMLRELPPADRTTAAELNEVQRTAEAITPATPLLDQRTAVQNYWNAVASAITNDGGNGS